MWLQLIEAGLLVGDFIYHRYFDQGPADQPLPIEEIQLPRNDPGAPIPLLYGTCRVKSPILTWARLENDVGGTPIISAMFVLGVPFDGGGSSSVNRVLGMWGGEAKFAWTDGSGHPYTQSGDGGPEAPITGVLTDEGEGLVETLNGKSTQIVINDGDTGGDLGGAPTWMGRVMTRAPFAGPTYTYADIPDYRGYLSAFLFQIGAGSGWSINNGRNLPAYSFEVSSQISSFDASKWPAVGPAAVIGSDANPINVIYDLLTGHYGKLGLDPSYIDMVSFNAAADTLFREGNGYSRATDDAVSALDRINEILVQIDAAMYEDPTTGKLGIKLVRPDYDPTTIREITKANCVAIQNLAIGGWQGIANQLRLTFTNRADDYRDGSATASNQANAVGQDGLVRSVTLSMPGVTWQGLADQLAARELAARSRPLIKCTAVVDGSFWRIKPGDVVKLTWTAPDISGLVFRVASVDRGSLSDGRISLGLIQDVFWVWRNQPPVVTDFGGHLADTSGLASGG